MAENTHWGGTDDTIEDPEEKKVICCALDSYMWVSLQSAHSLEQQVTDVFPYLPCSASMRK